MNFQGKAKIYDAYRPRYAKACIQDLMNNMAEHGVVADIGAGTGRFAEQLLESGCHKVIVVEPEEEMRQIAISKLSQYEERYFSIHCTAEQLTIPDHSIDLITVAQAFHWFDKIKFKAQCQRVLKPDAHVVLIWNTFDMTKNICKDIEELSVSYGKKDAKISFENTIGDFYEQGKYEKRIYPNNIEMGQDEFIGYNLSKSFAPKETDKNYEAYISHIKVLFKFYQKKGKITIFQNTICYDGTI